MHHEDVQSEIPDLLRGRLSGETSAAIEAHLAQCDECEEVRRSVALIASAISREGESVFDAHAGMEDLRAYAADAERAPARVASHVAACASCALMVEMWRRRESRPAARAARPMLAALALLAAGVVMGAGIGILLSAAGASGRVLPGRPSPPAGPAPTAPVAAPVAGRAAETLSPSSEAGSRASGASHRSGQDGAREAHQAPSAPAEVGVRGGLPSRSIPLVHLRTLRGAQPPQAFDLGPGLEAVYVVTALVLPPGIAAETPVVFSVRGSDGARTWSSAPEAASLLRAQIDDVGMVGHLIPGEALGPGDYLFSAAAGEEPAQREIARIPFAIRAPAGASPPG